MNQAKKTMSRSVVHALGGLNEIRVLGRESFFSDLFKLENAIYTKSSGSYNALKLIPRQLIESMAAIFLIILFISASTDNNANELIPTLGIFAAACLRILPLVNNLMGQLNQLHHNKYSVSLLYDEFQKLEQHYLHDLHDNDSRLPFSSLALKKISFKYPTLKNLVLDNASLTIKRGEAIGLMGISGSGKTTLVNLILGLLKPDSGSILVDNASFYDLRAWLNNFAYIPQMSFILNDSLKRNIALGIKDEAIDDKKLQQVIKQAQLSEVVTNLQLGVDTILGEQGIRLSGGQRQRVALARALYFDREIIIMDEATSALDNETEYEVIQAIKELRGLKTLIIIAHRLTTLEYCDLIYKVVDGEIKKVTTERVV